MKGSRDIEGCRERFDAKWTPEPNTGCWLWTGGMDTRGYGCFAVGRKSLGAHRVSWILANGPIPEGDDYFGVCVLHVCDVPLCVNPAHLRLGTHQENMADRDRKGRASQGERHRSAKLTAADVMRVRTAVAAGRLGIDLARELGVGKSTISMIVTGRNWKSLR